MKYIRTCLQTDKTSKLTDLKTHLQRTSFHIHMYTFVFISKHNMRNARSEIHHFILDIKTVTCCDH